VAAGLFLSWYAFPEIGLLSKNAMDVTQRL
jgi:hypothetical protein